MNNTLIHLFILVTMGTISSFFYWFILKNFQKDKIQKLVAYSLTLFFVFKTLSFATTVLGFYQLNMLKVLLAHVFCIASFFALRQAILIRSGFSVKPLLQNRDMYLNIAIVAVLLNTIVFYFIIDSLVARLSVSIINLSCLVASTIYQGFKHKRKSLGIADKFFIFCLITMFLVASSVPFLLYVYDAVLWYETLLLPMQILQMFLWSMSFTAVLMLDIIETQRNNSIRDVLTGLYNRDYFSQFVFKTLKHKTFNRTHGLLFIDIDFFKHVNDTYGHAAGDLVIQAVANTINTNLGKMGVVARFGGEEFAVFMKNQDYHQTKKLAQELCKIIEKLNIIYEDQRINITVSIGVSSLNNNFTLDNALKRADNALYKAKNSGRNRVCFA